MTFREFERCFWPGFAGLVLAFIAYMLLVRLPQADAEHAQRQREIDAFYVRNNCKPYGYVATREQPIRTYKCDNGIFIAKDMK